MSKAQVAKRSSSGGLSLSFIIGSVAAWCTNPTFVGWAGAGKSLLVGLGTSVASSIGGVVGFLGGGVVGGLLCGLLFRSKKAAIVGGIGFGVVGALGGAGVGGYEGYKTVESWLLNKDKANAKTVFNQNAGKQVAADSKTFVLDAKAIARYTV
ncbi:MAG: hypothetical protein K8R48_09895 [Alphaproteobacteria bacterium]|nr:hypothetical protein [Alphaproteobacteria bacterium]